MKFKNITMLLKNRRQILTVPVSLQIEVNKTWSTTAFSTMRIFSRWEHMFFQNFQIDQELLYSQMSLTFPNLLEEKSGKTNKKLG